MTKEPFVWGSQIKALSDIWVDLRANGLLCTEWKNNHQKFRGVVGVPEEPTDKLVRLDNNRLMGPKNFEWKK